MTRFFLTLSIILTTLSPLAGEDLRTDIITIRWDHWLWLERIAKGDPKFQPEGFAGLKAGTMQFPGRKTARQRYAECGITLGKGESFIYSVPTTQLVFRLTEDNRRRVAQLHQTVAAWQKGRCREWHHAEVAPMPPALEKRP